MAAGNFDASQLQLINLKAEQMWTDSQYAASFKPEAEAARAVRERQTVQFKEFTDWDEKRRKVKVMWLDSCGIEAQDCVETCEPSYAELESKSKPYEPNLCKSAGFSIDALKLKTDSYDMQDQVARGLAGCVKALDEWWAQQVLVKIKTFAGVNVAPDPFIYDNVAKTTKFTDLDPVNQYSGNLKLLANFMQQAKLNRINTPYIIDNGTFFVDMLNAAFDSPNAEGKGYAARLKVFENMLYDDQFNFLQAGLTDSLFMIGAGAVAFQTVNDNPSNQIVIGGNVQDTLYRIKSIVLPGVEYDVLYKIKCIVSGNKKRYVHTWEVKTQGLVELNPEGCPVTADVNGTPTVVTPTGVLSYTRVAPTPTPEA